VHTRSALASNRAAAEAPPTHPASDPGNHPDGFRIAGAPSPTSPALIAITSASAAHLMPDRSASTVGSSN